MPTRNVNLTGSLSRFRRDPDCLGAVRDASEVMRAGLRLLEREAKEDEEKLAVLRGLAAEGFDALDRGEGTTLEGEREVADFIKDIGGRAARRAARRSGGK